jgi:hypothetical protein
MNTAQGSLEELRYYCILAKDLEYVKDARAWEGLDDTSRLLGAYARTLLTPNS